MGVKWVRGCYTGSRTARLGLGGDVRESLWTFPVSSLSAREAAKQSPGRMRFMDLRLFLGPCGQAIERRSLGGEGAAVDWDFQG